MSIRECRTKCGAPMRTYHHLVRSQPTFILAVDYLARERAREAADYLARHRAEGVACVDDTDPSG